MADAYPSIPKKIKGSTWFDDFNRLSVNADNALMQYGYGQKDDKIGYAINPVSGLNLTYVSQTGTTGISSVKSLIGFWRPRDAQSPYNPPEGMEVQFTDIRVALPDADMKLGLCDLSATIPDDADACAAINMRLNITSQLTIDAVIGDGAADHSHQLGGNLQNASYDAVIKVPADRYPEISVTPHTGGETLKYVSTFQLSPAFTLGFFFSLRANVNGCNTRLSRYGVRYF